MAYDAGFSLTYLGSNSGHIMKYMSPFVPLFSIVQKVQGAFLSTGWVMILHIQFFRPIHNTVLYGSECEIQ